MFDRSDDIDAYDDCHGVHIRMTLGRFILWMAVVLAIAGHEAYKHHHPDAELSPSAIYSAVASSWSGGIHDNSLADQ
ncbi:MAG: hypothetical protein HKN47_22070 [Pirellulaceae bacterium]|nr:hypothetical protein [Pirellulaceae bacterium]